MSDNIDLKKKAKQQANKKYYESIKKLKELKKDSDNSDIKQDFFFQKPQIQAAPPQKEQPIYIPHQVQQPKQQTLMNKALETLIISTIPMVPLLIKQCLILYANRQPKQEKEHEPVSMHYSQQANTLDF